MQLESEQANRRRKGICSISKQPVFHPNCIVTAKVRRRNVPHRVLDHLLDRIREREIPAAQLGLLAEWLDTEPGVPAGKWFKRFSGMIVCGEGEMVKTFLRLGQAPDGDEVP